MSINQLLLNEEKPYMNIRVNNLQVDGDITGAGSTDTFQQVYNNSIPPEIELNNTIGGLNIKDQDGNIDNLFKISDNAETVDYIKLQKTNCALCGSTVDTNSDNSLAFGEGCNANGSRNIVLGKDSSTTGLNALDNVIIGNENEIKGSLLESAIVG